jgi:hypothetical protein
MVRTALVGISAVAVVICLAAAENPKRETDKPSTDAAADFRGKVLAITLKDPIKAVWLESVRVRSLGPRFFLVGTWAKPSENETAPAEFIWIPVDDILQIFEYKSIEDARKAMKQSK